MLWQVQCIQLVGHMLDNVLSIYFIKTNIGMSDVGYLIKRQYFVIFCNFVKFFFHICFTLQPISLHYTCPYYCPFPIFPVFPYAHIIAHFQFFPVFPTKGLCGLLLMMSVVCICSIKNIPEQKCNLQRLDMKKII